MLIPLYFYDNCTNELNLTIVDSEIIIKRNSHHAETSLKVFTEDQLTGFYTTRASSERYYRADYD